MISSRPFRILVAICVWAASLADGFSNPTLPLSKITVRAKLAALQASSVDLSTPSQDEAVTLGIREWPSQVKSGRWTEDVPEGSQRYVLEGSGTVVAFGNDDESESLVVGPGSLVSATKATTLEWEAKGEMILLTPGYEQFGTLLAVFAGLIVICGGLLAVS